MNPANDPKAIQLNNYDDRGQVMKSKRLANKTEWVVEVDLPRDQVSKVSTTRDVYVHEGDVNLSQHEHHIFKNPMKGKMKK